MFSLEKLTPKNQRFANFAYTHETVSVQMLVWTHLKVKESRHKNVEIPKKFQPNFDFSRETYFWNSIWF